ncbi:hypothetical protein [Bacillus cereus]|uniref:hypothetical protein n=1 Tax=Bacillus cereus TaxID=1396 RepID=UPI000BF7CBDF|nr:hypothetical protein [Bacillus cereus]PFR51035.1 hypothetical protein COK35_07665 [Bacillus cereus]
MGFYIELGSKLKDIYVDENLGDNYYWKVIDGKGYGFKYMRDYSGIMANPDKKQYYNNKPKLGLFDIQVKIEGSDYNITHKKIICDLLKYSNVKSCQRIWYGIDPGKVAKNEIEEKVLTLLGLLMFEQELNWGNGVYQRETFFSPKMKFRPRDMLMGFLAMFFDYKKNNQMCSDYIKLVETYKYWTDNKTSPTFPGGDYRLLDKNIKNKYFEALKSVSFDKNVPFIYQKRKEHMDQLASKASPNKGYTIYSNKIN